MKNRIIFFSILSLLIPSFIIACLSLWLWNYSEQPAGLGLQKTVNIRPGITLNSAADQLYKEGLIKSPFQFKLLAFIKGCEKAIKAGEYRLSGSMTPLKILNILSSGRVKLKRITIPEGYNLKQIAQAVQKAGIVSKDSFLKVATDPELSSKLCRGTSGCEGYLFPDTYYFPSGTAPEDLIRSMVSRFNQIFIDKWENRSALLGFTVHEIVTLASIIEKETGKAFERPIISSVFHNRLKKRMRLETDPTVIYGIKNFNGNLTRKDLKTPTPYNTYIIRGLPPGPIASPGFDALKAALYPEETDFIFFVSRKNGTHHFSTNIKDHNRAVFKYQLKKNK